MWISRSSQPSFFKNLDSRLDLFADAIVHPGAKIFLGDADAQAFDWLFHRGAIIGHGGRRGSRVVRVAALRSLAECDATSRVFVANGPMRSREDAKAISP